ncbi:hypothetical protein D9757_009515 [Collybiopsis confluens]|uniref:Uncharacterized protein n=1 Tax=Collybiopsis confluens TaxID=2823264 RepID=A0A8H5H8J5_9AGAR|nr:hypothetical protein D9757_013795 [Collybiopsis confluens]KAF5378644.1 hypothetical protein D9757_009515 [Collybiopsis confluens]
MSDDAVASSDVDGDGIIARLEDLDIEYYPPILSKQQLLDRYREGFHVAFNDPRVQRISALPRYAAYTTAKSASGDELDIPLKLNKSTSSLLSYATRKDISSKRQISAKDTPRSRANPQDKSDSRRAWLTGWLLINGMFACHISHMPPCCHLLVQFAHILLPKSERTNTRLLSIYEFILGMEQGTLNIHSRLFLLPLKANIHHFIDDDVFAAVPSYEDLVGINHFFRMVLNRVSLDDVSEDLSNEQQDEMKGLQSLWEQKRLGVDALNLPSFQDGRIHRYHVLIHPHSFVPEVREDLIKDKSCDFYSHLSPFAAFLNTLRILRNWADGNQVPAHKSVKNVTLAEALKLSDPSIPNGRAILDQFNSALSLLDSILSYYEAPASVDVFGGRALDGDDGDDAKTDQDRDRETNNETFRRYGLTGLKLGQWNEKATGGKQAGGLKEKGAENRDGAPNNSSSRDPLDELNLPCEGDLFTLQCYESLTDDWSFDDSDDGDIIEEPNAHDFSLGPSPAQQVVLDWRRSWYSSPVSTSSVLSRCSTTVASSPSVTTTSPSSIEPPLPNPRNVIAGGQQNAVHNLCRSLKISGLEYVVTAKDYHRKGSTRIAERGEYQVSAIARRVFANFAIL